MQLFLISLLPRLLLLTEFPKTQKERKKKNLFFVVEQVDCSNFHAHPLSAEVCTATHWKVKSIIRKCEENKIAHRREQRKRLQWMCGWGLSKLCEQLGLLDRTILILFLGLSQREEQQNKEEKKIESLNSCTILLLALAHEQTTQCKRKRKRINKNNTHNYSWILKASPALINSPKKSHDHYMPDFFWSMFLSKKEKK